MHGETHCSIDDCGRSSRFHPRVVGATHRSDSSTAEDGPAILFPRKPLRELAETLMRVADAGQWTFRDASKAIREAMPKWMSDREQAKECLSMIDDAVSYEASHETIPTVFADRVRKTVDWLPALPANATGDDEAEESAVTALGEALPLNEWKEATARAAERYEAKSNAARTKATIEARRFLHSLDAAGATVDEGVLTDSQRERTNMPAR